MQPLPPSPWHSAPTAKAKNPSLGFPWEEVPAPTTARDEPLLQPALASQPGGSSSEQAGKKEPFQKPRS